MKRRDHQRVPAKGRSGRLHEPLLILAATPFALVGAGAIASPSDGSRTDSNTAAVVAPAPTLKRMPTVQELISVLKSSEAGPSQARPELRDRPKPASEVTDASHGGLFSDNSEQDGAGRLLTLHGRLEVEAVRKVNFDLENLSPDRTQLHPKARIDLGVHPQKDLFVFLSLQLEDALEIRGSQALSTKERLKIREAFFVLKDVISNVDLQVGRQEFDDRRDWLYHAQLDGIRLTYDKNDVKFMVGYAREGLFRKDLLHRNHPGKLDNYVLSAQYNGLKHQHITGYFLDQQDDVRNHRIYFGIQAKGTVHHALKYWLEAAALRGHTSSRSLRANALDAGLIYAFAAPTHPALILGYARGSGGKSDTVDRRFRQTGLQNNADRLSGFAKVRYYGELLDPELSNMAIVTGGIGVRPSTKSAVEFVVHGYRQLDLADDPIRGSPIKVPSNGHNPDLGKELDVIGTMRLSERLGLEAKLGYYWPGDAMERTDDAVLIKTRLIYRF